MEKAQVETRIAQDVHIRLLGGFAVSVAGAIVPEGQWHSRRARSLVKLLALAQGHRLHRDQVIEALWPDSDLSAAANNFHQTLYNARRILETAGGFSLSLEEGFLSLSGSDRQDLSVDVDQFEAAAAHAEGLQDPQAYQDALDLYSGDLLPDDPYEEWALPRREALRQVYLNLLVDLSRLCENRQEYPQGIAALQQVLSVDKAREEAHVGLMRLHALSGQRQQALRQYQVLRDALQAELDAEPSEPTTQIVRGDPGRALLSRPCPRPPPAATTCRPSSLPSSAAKNRSAKSASWSWTSAW